MMLAQMDLYLVASSDLAMEATLQQKWRRTMQPISLRCNNQDSNDMLPLLVLRDILAANVAWICSHMADFLFLLSCALALGMLFPDAEDNVLNEIEVARKELELDLMLAVNRYHEVVSNM
jgi:hypothetical protein